MTKPRTLWLQLIVVAAISGALAGFATSLALLSMDTSDTVGPADFAHIDHVETHSLHVLNDKGDPRIRLMGEGTFADSGDETYGIAMGPMVGPDRMTLTVDSTEQHKNPSFRLNNEKGKTVAFLTYTDGVPAFMLKDHTRRAEYCLVPYNGTFIDGSIREASVTQPPQ